MPIVVMKLILALVLLLPTALRADTVQVAVAANFAAPARLIAAEFENATGHRALLSFGATGKFAAQIAHGAPFEALLAADADIPARLEREGVAEPGTRFTYAIGRLVLWSARNGVVDARGEVLRRGGFRKLALANPRLAPYGTAAMEVLAGLNLVDQLQGRVVQGENIAQTHQFVASGNADLGFVAYSQVIRGGGIGEGSGWLVPAELHRPIRQDAILLLRGRDKPAAKAWLAWMRGDPAQRIIREFGYDIAR